MDKKRGYVNKFYFKLVIDIVNKECIHYYSQDNKKFIQTFSKKNTNAIKSEYKKVPFQLIPKQFVFCFSVAHGNYSSPNHEGKVKLEYDSQIIYKD